MSDDKPYVARIDIDTSDIDRAKKELDDLTKDIKVKTKVDTPGSSASSGTGSKPHIMAAIKAQRKMDEIAAKSRATLDIIDAKSRSKKDEADISESLSAVRSRAKVDDIAAKSRATLDIIEAKTRSKKESADISDSLSAAAAQRKLEIHTRRQAELTTVADGTRYRLDAAQRLADSKATARRDLLQARIDERKRTDEASANRALMQDSKKRDTALRVGSLAVAAAITKMASMYAGLMTEVTNIRKLSLGADSNSGSITAGRTELSMLFDSSDAMLQKIADMQSNPADASLAIITKIAGYSDRSRLSQADILSAIVKQVGTIDDKWLTNKSVKEAKGLAFLSNSEIIRISKMVKTGEADNDIARFRALAKELAVDDKTDKSYSDFKKQLGGVGDRISNTVKRTLSGADTGTGKLIESGSQMIHGGLQRFRDTILKLETQGGSTGKYAISSTGAWGRGQLLQSTSAKPGYGIKPINIPSDIKHLMNQERGSSEVKNPKLRAWMAANEAENLRFMQDYSGAMLKAAKGNVGDALQAYNQGVGGMHNRSAEGAKYRRNGLAIYNSASKQPSSKTTTSTQQKVKVIVSNKNQNDINVQGHSL